MVDDAELVERLRAGDDKAFVALVDRYHSPLVRLAASFVGSRAVAEEVVQDTWLGVVRGIDRFEGRSSFKTWLFRILVNRARTTGAKERRQAPTPPANEPAVPADRFRPDGRWASPPVMWEEATVDRLVAGELAERISGFLDELPEAQRQVVVMRDLEGLPSAEVCSVLGISEANQRVLLHRGRSRIRDRLDRELEVQP
jgi:RNA polymerase sigma-70 factor (ECF subfamily)